MMKCRTASPNMPNIRKELRGVIALISVCCLHRHHRLIVHLRQTRYGGQVNLVDIAYQCLGVVLEGFAHSFGDSGQD
jgi:hypothetical protein